MNEFLKWIVLSSDNPKQVSQTIRGVLMLQVPLVVSFLSELGWLNSDALLVQYITAFTAIIGLVLLVIGLVRKVVNTIWKKKTPVKAVKKKK